MDPTDREIGIGRELGGVCRRSAHRQQKGMGRGSEKRGAGKKRAEKKAGRTKNAAVAEKPDGKERGSGEKRRGPPGRQRTRRAAVLQKWRTTRMPSGCPAEVVVQESMT